MHNLSITSGELAKFLSGRLIGDPDKKLTGLSEPQNVVSETFCFLKSKKSLSLIKDRNPGLSIISAELETSVSSSCLVVENIQLAMARLLEHFFHSRPPIPGVHPTAVIADSAEIGEGVEVGPYVVIGDRVKVGSRTILFPHVTIGEDSTIGSDCRIYYSVTVYHGCLVGDRVILHSGLRVGGDGFGYMFDGSAHRKIQQIGNVVIEDDVEVGANSTIDRATLGSTRIGAGTKIDNLVQIGHNCQIGKSCIFCGQVGIAGSVEIGNGVMIGGKVGISDHCKIGDRAMIRPSSMVGRNIEAGERVMGMKPYPEMEFGKLLLYYERLPDLYRRVKQLEDDKSSKSLDHP